MTPASIDPVGGDVVSSLPLARVARHARGALIVASLALCGASLSACAELSLPRALRIGSGATSHTLCSGVFISGQDVDRVYREEVRPEPGMGLIDGALRYEVDPARRSVRTTLAGGVATLAVHRPGEGCLLVRDGDPPLPAASPDPPAGAGAPEVQTADPALARAIDAAFAEPDPAWPRQTKAVVVMQHGRIVAERYAWGITAQTRLSGHSVSKSVVHALIGVLVRQGRLDPDAPAPVPPWQSSADPRRAITPEQLLRMASGLPWDETAGGWDAATRMWFDERDMAAFAARAQPVAPPGVEWHYSNQGLMLLSRMVRDAAAGESGDSAAARVRRFAERELFAPAGMRDVEMTFDATGTPLGSSHFYASARDWARFGQLYLDDGVAGGRRVLPPGWVARARTPTLGMGYGAGFWLNTSDARNEFGGRWGMPGAPAEAFFGRGHLGQFVVVVPSRQLVVVRLGLSHRPDGEIRSVGRLVAEVIAALGD